MRIAVLNPGSSSLKASLVEAPGDVTLATAAIDWGADATASADRADGVTAALDELAAAGPIDTIGYRVVHGGEALREPTRVDEHVLATIDQLADLAPLHNRIAAETIRAARRRLPDVPHVACFDTAFHATLPEEAWRYPLPSAWVEPHRIRRFGFHGLSVTWSVERTAALLDRPLEELRMVVAHLGSGCSVTAVRQGRSVDTSMGFTPLEGLMMGTRAGSIDPGVLLHLLRAGVSVEELADGLDHRSGLAIAAERGAGARELEAAAERGDAEASLVLSMFARRAAAGIAAAASALDRLDALVFTGGIGENSPGMRAAITGRLGVLGIPATDAPASEDAVLASASGVSVLRVAAREDLAIARATHRLLTSA